MPQFIDSTNPLGNRAFTNLRTAAMTLRRSDGRVATYAAGVVAELETIIPPQSESGV